MFDVESYAFMGPAIYAPDGEKYRRLELDDDEDRVFAEAIKNGWLAAMQHHFVAAAVPTSEQSYRYSLRVDNGQYLLGAVGPSLTVAAGARAAVTESLFVGPKLQGQLEDLHPELDRVADYGMLTIIAKPLFLLLQWVHNLTGNWGWAIVLVTVLIKLVFYPLSEASGRSMAKMRALAPRIKNIQERYKDEREQLGRQMMELYKREKINPLAGCLPIVVQIPVFLAFYWVLLESVEMRQAPFMLWIDDLSSRDPFFVLPLLMGAAMFGQYKLNPAPPDPIQAKVFMFMPLIMTVMFAWFPAGLVLYWLTNTVLSIAQQWRINRVVEAQAKKHAT
jgi:YidC/Oxa1 family membrane protein insertase